MRTIKCDICGKDMNPLVKRYTLSKWLGLFDRELDICDECVEEIKRLRAKERKAVNKVDEEVKG